MPGGAAEIHEPPLGQNDQPLAVRKDHLVDLRLDLFPDIVAQRADLDLAVEMADVADDRAVMHLAHVVERDHIDIAGRGNENVADRRRLVHRRDLVALHRRLQRADRVDLGHHDARALAPEARRRTLADIAKAAHDADLAGEHHIGGALDAVDQALADAIEIVEFRLGDAVIDVERRRLQFAVAHHLVKPVHPGCRLFRDAADFGEQMRMPVMHDLCRIAAIVEDHVRDPAIRPLQGLFDAPFVFLLGLPLPGEDRDAARRDRRGGVVLCRIDVARAPAHRSAEMNECLDQDRGLDRHVQAAGDAGA